MITSFKNEYEFLSNFWASKVWFEGFEYPTVEHAFQAAKTHNTLQRLEIRKASTPALAKKIGRKVTLRDDWEDIKLEVMEFLIWQKFTFDPVLRKALLNTGDDILMEGNTWGDRVWGVVEKNGDWYGENHLGKILMDIRSRIRKGQLGVNKVHDYSYRDR